MRVVAGIFLAEVWAAASTGLEEHGASVTEILFPLINFLIFFYLIKRFLFPIIRDHIRSRREEIITAVKEAERGKKQAEERVREYQGRLSRLRQEIDEIRAMTRKEGETEKNRLLQEAKELSLRMKEDAHFLVEQEIKIARHQLRREIARLAHEAARGAIQRHLAALDQERLVGEFMAELSGVR